MSQRSIPSDWLDKFSDPYAVLGVAVTADDRRVQKRYRNVAMLLHPDRYVSAEAAIRETANEMLMRVVNPAYEKLKQEKSRTESAALLRFQVRRISREGILKPQSDLARQLMTHPATEVDVFYEQAVVRLADAQYQPIEQFEVTTLQLSELNLVYLQLKMGEVLVRERPTGIVPAQEKPIQVAPTPSSADSYARRHYKRAQQYMKNQRWSQAVQELRDAIKLEADKSEFHALLGVAYLQQNLTGMATVYLRQALKLNPNDPLASRYAARLGIKTESPATQTQQNGSAAKNRGLFGLFRSRK